MDLTTATNGCRNWYQSLDNFELFCHHTFLKSLKGTVSGKLNPMLLDIIQKLSF